MKCADVEWFLTRGASAPFPYSRYLVVANVSWGLLRWEADVCALSNSGWLTEIEIKVSVADLKKDAEKTKHGQWAQDNMIREFFYAMPGAVWDKVKDAPPIPDYAGVIVITEDGRREYPRKATKKTHARKLTDSERLQLGRLGAMRYWTRLPTPQVILDREAKRTADEAQRWEKWNEDMKKLSADTAA